MRTKTSATPGIVTEIESAVAATSAAVATSVAAAASEIAAAAATATFFFENP